MVLVRKDVHAKWGWPGWIDEGLPVLSLSDVLEEVENDSELWLDEGTVVEWEAGVDPGGPFPEAQADKPVVVGSFEGGGWGRRIYANMVPATKASSWGQAGRTHAVAQMRKGKWWARRLSAKEVTRIFEHPDVTLCLASDDDARIRELGNSGPARMVRPWALGIERFLRPPSPWCPSSMDSIISRDTVRVCRGWMAQAAQDFTHMSKMG